MSNSKSPGSSTGKNGGIYQEVGLRGGKKKNFAAVKDDEKLPPTTKTGHKWQLVKRTPDSKR